MEWWEGLTDKQCFTVLKSVTQYNLATVQARGMDTSKLTLISDRLYADSDALETAAENEELTEAQAIEATPPHELWDTWIGSQSPREFVDLCDDAGADVRESLLGAVKSMNEGSHHVAKVNEGAVADRLYLVIEELFNTPEVSDEDDW